MNHENMLLAVMTLLLVVEVTVAINNFLTMKQNKITLYNTINNQQQRIEDLEKAMLFQAKNKEFLTALAEQKYDPSAFVISAEGVKVLPKGWRDAVVELEKKIQEPRS